MDELTTLKTIVEILIAVFESNLRKKGPYHVQF